MLSAFSGSEDDARGSGVPDPFGGDSQAYVECLEALEGLVEAALGRVDAEFLSSKVGAEFPSPNKEARP
jgi:hypothetical protein